MRNYGELVEEASEIEKSSPKGVVKYIALDLDKGDMIVSAPRPFAELLGIASKGGLKTETKMQQQKIERAPIRIAMPTIAQQKYVAPPEPPQKKVVEVQAKKEIRLLAKKAQEPKPENVSFKVEKSNLVLPNLSLPDQVSELEGIIESIKNKYFDKYQMEIAVKELDGLAKIVGSEKTTSDSLQSDIIKLRNRRLNEALALLPKE